VNMTYQQLMDELNRLVVSRSSGTLFIHSDCNHALTFTLESGQIIALYFGPRKGRKVIPLTLAISGGSCRFDPDGPSREPQDLPSTQEIMAQLNSNRVAPVTMPGSPSELSVEPWPEEIRGRFLGELQVVLTDHLGPIADIIFNESMSELNGQSVNEDSFQHLIDRLALNMESGDISRFQDQVADILSGIGPRK